MTSPTQQLAPALEVDARLTEIERGVNMLLNITPVNAAEAWADCERSDFGTVPTLRLRPLDFEPDLVRRDLYNLEIENVTDPALHGSVPLEIGDVERGIVEAMSEKLVADGMYFRWHRCDRQSGHCRAVPYNVSVW